MPHKNPERARAYGREWMKRSADKAREAMRRWRKSHPDQHAAASRERYARDPEKSKRITNASPRRAAVRRAMHARRRDRVRGLPSFSAGEWLELTARYGGCCAYCGDRGQLHADHRMPLPRGGASTIDNILPACARCNLRKHSLTEEEFRARRASERHDDLELTHEAG